MASDPPVGAIVEVAAGKGVVRFCGTTSFSPGKWVGIELDQAKGKNDGSINGTSYFKCGPLRGVFVRPSQVKVIQATPASSRAPTTSARPGAAAAHARRQSTQGLPRQASLASSAASSSRSASPAKNGGTTPSRAGTSSVRTSANSSPGPKPRFPTSSASPAKTPTTASAKRLSVHLPRKSLSRTATGDGPPLSPVIKSPAAALASASATRTMVRSPPPDPEPRRAASPLAAPPMTATSSQFPQSLAGAGAEIGMGTSPPQPSKLAIRPPSSANTNGSVEPMSPLKPPDHADLPSPITARLPPDDTELQELRAKIRVLEAKRADDARHVRELETRLSEAESFVALRPKLQAKLNQLQTDLTSTRRELSDAQQLAGLADGRHVDAQEQLEMAMLDKEVAEERAEMAEQELEEVSERLAQVEVELQHVKEGGGGVEGGGEGEGRGEEREEGGESSAKSSLAYIQLEKQNERLKEALIRLRDMSQETEHDQRHRIAELEKELVAIDDLQGQYESTLIKLSNAETQIDDLKDQLDDALGAEEMLVQLTERNLMLGEKIEEMRITIEDLEALKELNDELEENHVETEKGMQEELEAKDVAIREHVNKVNNLEDACQDLENTIGQFRDLVIQLQSDLESLRAQTQDAQQESASAASQTAAIMSLNLKLQSSASKNQARLIELELRRLEAREARALLGIVQPYLPQSYVESGDADATSAYLFFARMGAKIDLINSVVASAHGLPESLTAPSAPGGVSEVLVGICEMRGRAAALAILCKRFAAVLRRCDAPSFLSAGRVFAEIAPLEKRLDMHLEVLRRDSFREMEFVNDVVKMQAQFDHLAEAYFGGFEHDLGERELGCAVSFEMDLDVFGASLAVTKSAVRAALKDDDVTREMGELDPEKELFEPLQSLLEQCKGAKVLARKLTKRVEELISENSALKTSLMPRLTALSNGVPELVNFGIDLAQQVIPHISDARSAKAPFQLAAVLAYAKQTAMATVAKDLSPTASCWEAVGEAIAHLANQCNGFLPVAMESESVVKISGTPPWVARIADIKASTAINVEAERKAAQLAEEIQGLMRTLKGKDVAIQESGVKIEHLERRMETVKRQADAIVELEIELAKSRKQERAYEEAMEQLQTEYDALEAELAKVKSAVSGHERTVSGAQPIESESMAVEGTLETSQLIEQIEALRGTVRFLRNENAYLKGQDLLKEIQSLPLLPDPAPVPRPASPRTPPLAPSSLSDSDAESEFDSLPSFRAPRVPRARALATETKMLYRDVIRFSASPRVVDLSVMHARRKAEVEGADAGAGGDGAAEGEEGKEGKAQGASKAGRSGRVWMPRKATPAHQIMERKAEAERLSRRVKGLMDRANAL
ncbi:hypothetical protein CONPUDRAFT_161877 [Coniophora puteana RWD-64-598 SS2]|uniref:CAP-Gly domain-containing protein n=1 Tax=Coniophora puteana (strain RWD-64-598) TaxID=741705 RepID=A0A5M3N786_CONPW|nr:uncharacterized protein CONPUDRAFT_161877 [Coniophora puteana RWD-64-598 SS2]EIW87309.1 hypothetical protein CONPUDRAFT_161877 [Coniophora puteana RWD-64-598 SS2]